jgi:hypothetical protein
MSNEKEKLEYKIEKSHRKKLQQKLDDIEKELSENRITQQKITTKRRRENIYVLFALAIIGGFLSITQRSSVVLEPQFIGAFGIFAIASSIFIMIKINTVAFSNVSFSEGNNIDDYADYLFIFSINGIFLLAIAIAIVNTLNIGVSDVQPVVIPLLISIISGVLSFLTQLQIKRKRRKNMEERITTREEIKQELIDDIISEIEKLRKADDQQDELNKFPQLALYIEQCRHEFTKPEDFDPIFEEIDDLESLSDGLEDSIRQNFTEAKEYVRNKVMENASIDEKQKRLEEEYEDIIFDYEISNSS